MDPADIVPGPIGAGPRPGDGSKGRPACFAASYRILKG